jgi:hypothetical protein
MVSPCLTGVQSIAKSFFARETPLEERKHFNLEGASFLFHSTG